MEGTNGNSFRCSEIEKEVCSPENREVIEKKGFFRVIGICKQECNGRKKCCILQKINNEGGE